MLLPALGRKVAVKKRPSLAPAQRVATLLLRVEPAAWEVRAVAAVRAAARPRARAQQEPERKAARELQAKVAEKARALAVAHRASAAGARLAVPEVAPPRVVVENRAPDQAATS